MRTLVTIAIWCALAAQATAATLDRVRETGKFTIAGFAHTIKR